MMIPNKICGPSVSLQHVSLLNGHETLLDNVNCTFDKGRWHGIYGPNGGGKSSLLKTILGLQTHKGTVKIHWPKDNITTIFGLGTIGYLPQLLPFDTSLPISVKDFLLMSLQRKPLWFYRRLSSEVTDALSSVDLLDKLECKLGDLSGGEIQRLLLICTLLKQPQLLILDEPMTGLDNEGKKKVLSILSRFHHSGGTIIMVEHDLDLVNKYCDSIHRINQKVVETDTIQSLNVSQKLSNSES